MAPAELLDGPNPIPRLQLTWRIQIAQKDRRDRSHDVEVFSTRQFCEEDQHDAQMDEVRRLPDGTLCTFAGSRQEPGHSPRGRPPILQEVLAEVYPGAIHHQQAEHDREDEGQHLYALALVAANIAHRIYD